MTQPRDPADGGFVPAPPAVPAPPEPPGSTWPARPPEPAPVPPPGWPEQHPPGDWSAPGWAPPRRNGPSIASLFLGLFSLPAVLFVVPGVILAILAIALGLIGRGRVKRGEADTYGIATTGVGLGSLALIASVVWIAVLYVADRSNQRDYEECLRSGQVPRVCVEEYEPTDP